MTRKTVLSAYIALVALLCFLAARNHLASWTWVDFEGQWIIDTYIFEHVNPYLPTTADVLQAHNLQKVPDDWGSSPWGLVLGQLFYAGWLPERAAALYFIGLYIGAFLFTTACALRRFRHHWRQVLLFAMLAVPTCSFSMMAGNAGALLALCLLWALFLSRSHGVLAGIALSLAMIKPQMALIFCLYLLLERRLLTVLVAAAIDTTALLLACLALHTSPWQLLADFTSCGIGNPADCFYGLLTLSADYLPYSLYASMLLGCAYATAYYYRNYRRDSLTRLAPFCVAAAFWSYTWGLEMLVQLPLAMLAWRHLQANNGIDRLRWAVVMPYCMLNNYAVLYLYGVVYHFTGLTPTPYRPTYMLYVLMLIALVFSYTPVRYSFRNSTAG